MKIPKDNLLEDVQKCLTDPIYNVMHNFSLKKSREYYDKRVEQWNNGNYLHNPVNKEEERIFIFNSLDELAIKSIEAQNIYTKLSKEKFIKGCVWYISGKNVVVKWNRLKTIDEWIIKGLTDAFELCYNNPEESIRKMLIEKLGKGYYSNVEIHMFAEGLISEEVLARLGKYEGPQRIEGRDLDKDIEAAIKALYDIQECNTKKDVEVLTLKI